MADEWDAGTYQRVSEPQVAWGRRVVERIPLEGDERVLDAGCGTGRVTRIIAERVPRGTVEAVDGSARMVAEATRQLADLAPRVRVRQGDLLELEVEPPVERDRVNGHLPLDPRPRAPLRAPVRGARARRAPGGAVRRGGQHRADPARGR